MILSHELKLSNHAVRMQYCNWLLAGTANEHLEFNRYFNVVEAGFYQNAVVSKPEYISELFQVCFKTHLEPIFRNSNSGSLV